ncbi:hypothetical protein DL767_003727 [Monosporascus sp. MG133]|nr:hypothetical protein DL767_003727 [Monosporascus sp. MG133]
MLPGADVLTGAVTVADHCMTLEAGFTSIKELSVEGYIIGPNVYSSLTLLSIMGGHGDIQELPPGRGVALLACGGEAQFVLEWEGRRRARDQRPASLAALKAGDRSIEHWYYLDEEVADRMKVKGAILVATRHIQEGLLADSRELPPKAIDEIEKLVPLSRSAYGLAIRRGVKIVLGTDNYSSNPEQPLAHGKNAMELRYAVKGRNDSATGHRGLHGDAT